MGNKGFSIIPRTLLENITYLVRALPLRSVPTFIELLIGAMITQSGFVTQAWLAISPLRTWTSYYKWIKDGKWSWVALGVQLAKMVVRFYLQPNWFLIFDDTLVYRNSKKAQGAESITSTGIGSIALYMPEGNAGSVWPCPSPPARNIPQFLSLVTAHEG